MTEIMFAPCSSTTNDQLPAEVLADYEDEELFELQGSFRDLFANGVDFVEFYKFIKDRVVLVSPDASMTVNGDPPSHHPYIVEMMFSASSSSDDDANDPKSKTKPKKSQVSGTTEEATAPILNGLLEYFIASQKEDSTIDVAFKCFATTPRKPLGRLNPINVFDLQSSAKVSLSFQFVALNESHFTAAFSSEGVTAVEFRQCTLEGLKEICNIDNAKGPERLVFSCSQSEFPNIAALVAANKSTVKDLDLILHFLMDEANFKRLTRALQQNQHVERLKIEYMALDDDEWTTLCASLSSHDTLTHLQLAFTEKFVDAPRRLTPERRMARSKEVLELVQANPNLVEMKWPEFQQDPAVAAEIEQALAKNRS